MKRHVWRVSYFFIIWLSKIETFSTFMNSHQKIFENSYFRIFTQKIPKLEFSLYKTIFSKLKHHYYNISLYISIYTIFDGRGHSRVSLVNREFVLLIILSRFLDEFPFKAFFISSIFFLQLFKSSPLFQLACSVRLKLDCSVCLELDCSIRLELSSLLLVRGL